MNLKNALIYLFFLFLMEGAYCQPVCHYKWEPSPPITAATPSQTPTSNCIASRGSILSFAVFFYDWERIKDLPPSSCLTHPPPPAFPNSSTAYLTFNPASTYNITFTVSNSAHAVFNGGLATVSEPAVPYGPVEAGAAWPPPTNTISMGRRYLTNARVILNVLDAWATMAAPPTITVTAVITDNTPAASIPIGDSGSTLDAASLTLTWTITYSNVCPTTITLVDPARDNIWINILGSDPSGTCTGMPSTDIRSFCYKCGPDIGAVGSPDYAGIAINEVFGGRFANFEMIDLNPTFVATRPEFMNNKDLFASFIFPAANQATFNIDALDRFEDSHSLNALLEPIIDIAFTPNAIRDERVSYHFDLTYRCQATNIRRTTVFRRLLVNEPSIVRIPQLKKTHHP